MSREVVVLGTAGHAAVCVEVLQTSGEQVIGCVGPPSPHRSLPVPVLGDDELLEDLSRQGVTRAFVAIGSNSVRQRLAALAKSQGFSLINAISPNATLSPTAGFDENVLVMPGAVVNAYSRLGAGSIINTGATIDHDNQIGEYAHIAPGCHLAGAVAVGEGSFLGVGCVVIPNITIGAWSQLGAGSVVVRDVPDNALAYGSPARIARAAE